MSNEKVTCFLPCRAGSQRVKHKNIKPFASFKYGLAEKKIKQLIKTELIDKVVLSTDDEDILSYASKINNPKLCLHKRDEALASSETSTDSLVKHAVDLIPEGHILWTHVTSPFIEAEHYTQAIKLYFEQLENGFDSLMSTTPLYSFLWRDGKPLNYERDLEKWPRTQTLKPVYEINSGIFLASADIYRKFGDRIGDSPYLYELDKITSFDVDWPEDFILAEQIAKKIIDIY